MVAPSPRPRLCCSFDSKSSIETDETGLIIAADLKAPPFAASIGPCMVAIVKTCKLCGVDTGNATADIPLVFKAR
jgi:hypothetical protein